MLYRTSLRQLLSYNGFIGVLLLSVALSAVDSASALGQQTSDQEIQRIAETMAGGIQKAARKRAAVVDFTDLQGNVTELGRYLAERLSVSLFQHATSFEVIDRTHLKTILQEHKLASSGIIDPATARQLGQIAGVDALVTGTITPIGESVDLSVKVLDTESARMIAADMGTIAKTEAISGLMGKEVSSEGSRFSSSSRSSESSSVATSSSYGQETETGGVRFKLVNCRYSGSAVLFDFIVTNTRDRAVSMSFSLDCDPPYSSSYVIDDAGSQFPIDYTKIGAAEKSCGQYGRDSRLEPGIPVKCITRVSGISASTNSLSLILMDGSTRWTFKNVSVQPNK